MDLQKTASDNQWQVGSLEVSLTPQPLIAENLALPVYQYVEVAAYAENQDEVYCGPKGTPLDQGYPVGNGGFKIPIDKASKIYVWSLVQDSGDFVKWIGV